MMQKSDEEICCSDFRVSAAQPQLGGVWGSVFPEITRDDVQSPTVDVLNNYSNPLQPFR